jgi:hypothetical protein
MVGFLSSRAAQASPWHATPDDEVTRAETFLETPELVGQAQSILRPTVGMEHRHFRLTPRSEAQDARFAPTPKMARALAVVEVIHSIQTGGGKSYTPRYALGVAARGWRQCSTTASR